MRRLYDNVFVTIFPQITNRGDDVLDIENLLRNPFVLPFLGFGLPFLPHGPDDIGCKRHSYRNARERIFDFLLNIGD